MQSNARRAASSGIEDDGAGGGGEKQVASLVALAPVEIEHIGQRAGDRVERAAGLDALAGD
jgi:hypothetical protein